MEDRAPYTGENDPPSLPMFERLTKTLMDSVCGPGAYESLAYLPGDAGALDTWRAHVRALLTEMRKPSESMLGAMDDADAWAWERRIDAILAEAGQNAKSEG